MKQFAKFASLFGILALSACVSIELGQTKPVPAKNVTYQAPASVFHEFSLDNVDKAWRNDKNGNSISFFTDCADKTDPTLEMLQSGVLQGVEDLNFEKTENIQYNGREALHSVVGGKVDGVETKLEILVFKKNSCIFVLNYVGVKSKFAQNERDFAKFMKGFSVP